MKRKAIIGNSSKYIFKKHMFMNRTVMPEN